MPRISIPWKTYLYYKKKLSWQDRAIYEAILDGLLEWKRRIPIPPLEEPDHIYDVFTMVLRDVPMLFHVSNGLRIGVGSCNYVVPDYIMNEQLYIKYYAEVLKFLKTSHGLLGKYGAFNKLQLMHDSIVKHVRYSNTDTNNEHNVLGTILEKKAVCESVAKAYKLLCDYNMIPAIVVFGYSDANNRSVRENSVSTTATFPEDNHAWNIVKLDDEWYNADLTFDITLGNFNASKASRYDYFLRSDQIFDFEHYASKRELLPKCPNDYNLYRKINQYAQTTDDVQTVIKNVLQKNSKAKTIAFGVDANLDVSENEVAVAANEACLLNGKKISSYTHNVKTGVFCVTIE